jgi:hypothetical protein
MSRPSAKRSPKGPIVHGAYGVGLLGAERITSWLVEAPDDWPRVRVERHQSRVLSPRTFLNGDQATFALTREGQLLVDPAAGICVFTTPQLVSDAELVHPYLAPVGAAFAWWAGREALHAGGFCAGGGVWALIGNRGSGKSSLLAWLALSGVDVVTDDMLVIDGGMALAGPRCVDLRASAAERFGVGELLSIQGERERWRVMLGPVRPELPFHGSVFLEWGDALELRLLGASERLLRLASNRSMMVEPRNSDVLLDLAAMPAWELTRPKEWASLPLVMERLVGLPAL